MRIAIVLTPISDHHLRLASQLGVSDVVIRFPGLEYSDLADLKTRIESFGLRVSVMEGYLPIEDIKLGGGRRDAEIEQMKTLIRNMGRAGIGLLCYNFIAGGDWARTSVNEKGRGGALVTGFDLSDLPQPSSSNVDLPSADRLWENLDTFLERILPVAEECGVTLAMHPDDPPIPNFQGYPRIMNSVEGFERLVGLRSGPANGICFCQGTFAEMGVDVPSTIRRLGPHIKYVHFRDIRGTSSRFVETFHDEGQTDMVEAMRAYRDIGFDGPMRPDHVPQLAGEEEGEAGYTMLGRLFAVGYMRGLMQAVGENSA
jgi:mannonate dehydratase